MSSPTSAASSPARVASGSAALCHVPSSRFDGMICATDELAPAVRLFEAAELRGRKRREFEVWREAAHERAFAKIGGRRWDRSRVRTVAERLTALRVYRRPPDVLA